MKPISRLLGLIILTWVVHVLLVTSYSKLLTDTHGLAFRIIYALELTTTFSLPLRLFLKKQSRKPALGVLLGLVIGYLALVDTTLSVLIPSVRQIFDFWHFALAYALLAATLTVLYKTTKKIR